MIATTNTKISMLLIAAAVLLTAVNGFVQPFAASHKSTAAVAQPQSSATTTTALNMASDDDLLRSARSSRSAGADDNVVELRRPIGVVLTEDDNGNVYVETLAPKGNAARSGKVCFLV